VASFALLAVFPGLATVVSLYGLFGGRVTKCHFVRSGMSS
jgi:uncharacterized BrkB/YihY/UPF0761 family membrane protein